MAEIKTLHLSIQGRVQGVWYRGWTVDQARARGLAGWVRNRADGSVEAVVSGPAEAVDALVDACRKGPPLARVDRVIAEPAPVPEQTGFEKLPTV